MKNTEIKLAEFYENTDKWENRELGADEEFASLASEADDDELMNLLNEPDDESIDSKMQLISIRLPQTLIADLKNIGKVEGKNVVQIYIKRTQQNKHLRPIIELKEFQKTNTLKPNESQTLNFVLNRRAFSRYCNRSNGWIVDKGIYEICVANSSEDIVLSQQLELQGDKIPPIKIDDNTTIGELIEHPNTKNFIESIVSKFGNKGNDAISTQMNKAMLFNAPIRLVKNVAKMTDDNYANFKHKIIEDMKK